MDNKKPLCRENPDTICLTCSAAMVMEKQGKEDLYLTEIYCTRCKAMTWGGIHKSIVRTCSWYEKAVG